MLEHCHIYEYISLSGVHPQLRIFTRGVSCMWNVLPQLKDLLMFQQNAKFYCSEARSAYIYEKLPEADAIMNLII